jgi:hypothetical protein
MDVQARPADVLMARLCGKVLGGDFAAAQIWFDQRVLDRYRGQDGARVIRTNSAGRVKAASGWSLDFGIATGDRLIHASAADVSQRVPPSEHEHWLEFVLVLPTSQTFLMMRLGSNVCIDDGDVRAWPGGEG